MSWKMTLEGTQQEVLMYIYIYIYKYKNETSMQGVLPNEFSATTLIFPLWVYLGNKYRNILGDGGMCNNWPDDCEKAEVDIRKSWENEVGPNFWSVELSRFPAYFKGSIS